MTFTEFAGRRPLYGEAVRIAEHTEKLVEVERDLNIALARLLASAVARVRT